MDKISLLLTSLLGLALVLMLAPGVFAMNRGKVLRNVALWLALILATALAYRLFGPGRLAGLSGPSAAPTQAREAPERYSPAVDSSGDDKETTDGQDDEDDGDQGYTPPKE